LQGIVVDKEFEVLLKELQRDRFITAKTGRVIKKGKELKEAKGIIVQVSSLDPLFLT
jgi:hypothetical protein